MLKEIIIAIQAYFKAHSFIGKHKLWKWIIIPGIFYMLLFAVSMYFFGKSATLVIEEITRRTGITAWLQRFDSGFLSFVVTLFGLVLWLILMQFYFSLFKYIWLIVGSPVFAYLSEKTESIIEGREFPFSMMQLAKDIVRGIGIALRNTLWQTVYIIFILVLSLLPVIGWTAPLFAIIIECFYYGFSMLDYTMERRQKTVAESVYFINHHKGLAIGNGLMFYLMHGLPIIGWVMAPAYAVIAATLSVYPLKDNNNA